MHTELIFSDIDGTLLNTHRSLSAYTIEVLKKVREMVPFLLVSARMPKQMRHIQVQFLAGGDPMICYNGALVISDEKVLHSQEVSLDVVEWIIQYNQKHQNKVHISLFYNDDWFAPQYDYWAKREQENTKVSPDILSNAEAVALWRAKGVGVHKITCMGQENYISQMYDALFERFSEELHLYRSKDTYIEIAHKEVSKLTGIQCLINHKYSKVSLQNVMAFGDNYNDIEMLRSVGCGVAVANAIEPVKNAARFVTLAHTQDGVGKYLSEVFGF